MTIKFCPFCGGTDAIELDERDAYVTLVEAGQETSPEEGPDAVYSFGCCGRAVVVLAKDD